MSPEFVNMKESVICAAKYFLVIISTLEVQKFTGKLCNAVPTHKNLGFINKPALRCHANL